MRTTVLTLSVFSALLSLAPPSGAELLSLADSEWIGDADESLPAPGPGPTSPSGSTARS
jgi:hypothetical protein